VKHDLDKNGYLDKKEAKTFVDEISQCIEKERAKNYDPTKFDALFAKFDENKDQYLSKSEMAVFIKKVFQKGSN
jgi:polyhydroxyalkanoate synthesis regulator phasin